MIELYAKNQYLEFIEKEIATTDSLNFFQIHFVFDESWEGFSKHASFFNTLKGDRYVKQINSSNTIYVPNEVLKNNLPIFVGIYGINASGIRLTTNTLQIPIVNSAYTEKPIIVDEFYDDPSEFVKTQKEHIKYIRENEGFFEYSKDGIRWSQVRGEAGLGLPSGGDEGQFLQKASNNNYETEWKSFDTEVDKESKNGVSGEAVYKFVGEYLEDYEQDTPIDIDNIKDLFN